MHDSAIVQKRKTVDDAFCPHLHGFRRKSLTILRHDFVERLPRHVLHDDPMILISILPDIKDCDEIGVLQIQTLLDPSQLNLGVVECNVNQEQLRYDIDDVMKKNSDNLKTGLEN